MSVPPLAATLTTLLLAIISDGVAMTKPLASLEGFYELHLFPEKDRFDYTVSETHKASQWMHVIAFATLMLALIFTVINIFLSAQATGSDGNRYVRRFTMWSTTLVGLGTACYIAAVSMLIKVAADYKHIADDIPLPTPNAEMQTGGIMDLVGFMSAIAAFVLVMWAVVSTKRQGYMRLI